MSAIKIDRLSFKYDKEILKNISVDIEAGAFVSLLGINETYETFAISKENGVCQSTK